MVVNVDINHEEINYLIWKYLIDGGFQHTAFVLANETNLVNSHFSDPPDNVPSESLLRIIHRGCLYVGEVLEESEEEEKTYGVLEAARLIQQGADGLEDLPEFRFHTLGRLVPSAQAAAAAATIAVAASAAASAAAAAAASAAPVMVAETGPAPPGPAPLADAVAVVNEGRTPAVDGAAVAPVVAAVAAPNVALNEHENNGLNALSDDDAETLSSVSSGVGEVRGEEHLEYTPEELFKSRTVFLLDGHFMTGIDIEWHPTDEALLSSASDQTTSVRIWELNLARENWVGEGDLLLRKSVILSQEGVNGPLTSCVEAKWCTKNTDLVTTINSDGLVRLFDRSGTIISSSELHRPLRTLRMSHMTSPGRCYAACVANEKTIYVWCPEEKNLELPLATFPHMIARVNDINFLTTNDGLMIASVGRTVVMFNILTSKSVKAFEGHTASIEALGTCVGSNYFVTASDDCTIKVWAPDSSTPIRSFASRTIAHYAVWNPNGKFVVGQWNDDVVRVYDLVISRCVKEFHGKIGDNLAFSPDGKYLAMGTTSGTVWVWKSDTLELYRVHPNAEEEPNRCLNITWSPDSEKFAGIYDDGTIKVFDVAS